MRLIPALACFASGMLWAGCLDAPRPLFQPQTGVNVVSYDVELDINPAGRHLVGTAELFIRHPDTLSVITLQLDGLMEVAEVFLNGQSAQHSRGNDILSVQGISGDSSVVMVSYYGTMDRGIEHDFVGDYHVLFSESWPDGGSGWLPGIHHPSDPASLELTVSVPNGYTVVGNEAVSSTNEDQGEWSNTTFYLSEEAPTYTFAFAISDGFEVERDSTSSGLPIHHYHYSGLPTGTSFLNRTPAVLDTLSRLLGPYPYSSYSTVKVPMQYAGMENAATSFLAVGLYREAVDLLEQVNIHEAVHQWFGDDIVPADWRDLWLAEGFATYLTTVVYERLDGIDVAREHWVRMPQLSNDDALRALVPAHYDEPEDLLTETVYQKGAVVLHLLRSIHGDEAFFAALRTIHEQFGDDPMSTEALQHLLENTFQVDLEAFFDYWVFGEQIPVLQTNWDESTGNLSWQIENDEGTLEDADFELLLIQNGVERYVSVLDGEAVLEGGAEPIVHPVAVILNVR